MTIEQWVAFASIQVVVVFMLVIMHSLKGTDEYNKQHKKGYVEDTCNLLSHRSMAERKPLIYAVCNKHKFKTH